MTQLLQSPYAVPVLQIIAGVAALQIVTGNNHFTEFASTKLAEMTAELLNATRNVVFDSPVIAISAGITYFVQEFATQRIPALSLSLQGATSMKVALCVAGILVVRSALSDYLTRVTNSEQNQNKDQNVKAARNLVIRNIVPIAVGCVAAYFAEVPVKLIQTGLFTVALIPVVKLLGKGFENFANLGVINNLTDTISGWVN